MDAVRLRSLVPRSIGTWLLYPCSGPAREHDAEELASVLGVEAHCIDVIRHPSHDRCDQHCWESLLDSARSGHYSMLLVSPECTTFSPARCVKGGPPPLRGNEAPHIYWLPDLSPADKERVRIGNLLAICCAQIVETFDSLGLP